MPLLTTATCPPSIDSSVIKGEIWCGAETRDPGPDSDMSTVCLSPWASCVITALLRQAETLSSFNPPDGAKSTKNNEVVPAWYG